MKDTIDIIVDGAIMAMFFIAGIIIGASTGRGELKNEVASIGVAHCQCNPTNGETMFIWHTNIVLNLPQK